jgi:hypothetical protein
MHGGDAFQLGDGSANVDCIHQYIGRDGQVHGGVKAGVISRGDLCDALTSSAALTNGFKIEDNLFDAALLMGALLSSMSIVIVLVLVLTFVGALALLVWRVTRLQTA